MARLVGVIIESIHRSHTFVSELHDSLGGRPVSTDEEHNNAIAALAQSSAVYRLWASPSAQPEWQQLQDSSTVLPASLQYWLQ
jgi:hypothetical protein